MRQNEDRFKFMAMFACNSLSVERDEHAASYMTANEWIDGNPDFFLHTPENIIAEMRATNTIWRVQIYPDTPIGFYHWYGSTLEQAIDQAMDQLEAA